MQRQFLSLNLVEAGSVVMTPGGVGNGGVEGGTVVVPKPSFVVLDTVLTYSRCYSEYFHQWTLRLNYHYHITLYLPLNIL